MRVLLRCHYPPGDILALTAAISGIRALHPSVSFNIWDTGEIQGHDGQAYPDIVLGNPDIDGSITPAECDRVVNFDYQPLIVPYNGIKRHVIIAMQEMICSDLSLAVNDACELRPRVYLTDNEKKERFIQEPYWLIFPGGKLDFTAKIWPAAFWQTLVNEVNASRRFKLVQAGNTASNCINPSLRGVTTMVGKTTLRQLFQLVYHSEGVVCGITMGMHAAAAFGKPCVVIAGGREGPWWEKYPNHTFVHSVGKLDCCRDGPCWRNFTTVPSPELSGKACVRPTKVKEQVVPYCLSQIDPLLVVNSMQSYYTAADVGQEIITKADVARLASSPSAFVPPDDIRKVAYVLEPARMLEFATINNDLFTDAARRTAEPYLAIRQKIVAQYFQHGTGCEGCNQRRAKSELDSNTLMAAMPFYHELKTLGLQTRQDLLTRLGRLFGEKRDRIYTTVFGEIR